MQWLRAHPYLASIVATFLLIGAGAVIVATRASVEAKGSSTRAWGQIGGYLLSPSGNAPLPTPSRQENLYSQVRSGPPFSYTPSTVQIPAGGGGSDEFDFETFIASLSHPSGSATVGAGGDASLNAYAFIPGGLISTTSSKKQRTGLQQALFTYGNEAGSTVQSYEERSRNAAQILKDQFEDRSDEGKRERLLGLAESMQRVSEELLALGEVPDVARSANDALAKSYRDMGVKLALVPQARGDDALVQAMLVYNAAVETFTKQYVALATLFSAHGVLFSPDDPGSVFTFSQAGL